MAAPSRNPIPALLERADAVAARYDAYIAANHSCHDGGPCAACAAHDAALLGIEERERAKERCR